MSKDWSVEEVDVIIADYFDMLTNELDGLPYNKTKHRNELPVTAVRGKKSVEFKHMNISAVLLTFNLPHIKGYAPAWNFEKNLLPERILRFIDSNKQIKMVLEQYAVRPNPQPHKQVDFANWRDTPPQASEEPEIAKEIKKLYTPKVGINYVDQEQRNTSLGLAGEKLVYNYELWRLRDSYADHVRWISKEEGDGAGFDILSKDEKGKDLFIEVKTTKLGKGTPIFFSRNEYEFSKDRSAEFMLYRVFNFSEEPKLFTAKGSFDEFCRTEPTNFIGRF